MACGVSLPINRPQATSYQSFVFFLLRQSRIKQEITALGLLLVKCDCGESCPRVPVLPGEAAGSVLQELWLSLWEVEVQLALPAKNCCQESPEELGEIPLCLLSCRNAGEVPCCPRCP